MLSLRRCSWYKLRCSVEMFRGDVLSVEISTERTSSPRSISISPRRCSRHKYMANRFIYTTVRSLLNVQKDSKSSWVSSTKQSLYILWSQLRCSWYHYVEWRVMTQRVRGFRLLNVLLQGGEDPYNASRFGSLFAKEPPVIGLFCGTWSIK